MPKKRPLPEDLHLSRVSLPSNLTGEDNDRKLLKAIAPLPFKLSTLAAALAHKCSPQAIKQYLASYTHTKVVALLKGRVNDKHPVIFYAAERNCTETVGLLLDYYEVDPNVVDIFGLPLLNFTVMRSKWTVLNPMEVVKSLLAYGASPDSIPRDMWILYLEPPAVEPPAPGEEQEPTIACTDAHRQILAETLHLSIRYYLYKASRLCLNKKRTIQLAKSNGFLPLLQVPYLVVGQTYPTELIVKTVSAHIGMNIKTPLIFAFAGHSGHGKTEVGKQMGQLLGVNMTIVDCAHISTVWELLGAAAGYRNSEDSSQLNKFLVANDGARSVVFLDEFDKTTEAVRNALLLLFDSGDYHSRVTNQHIDCGKTIWILATNLGDSAITNFHEENMKNMDEEDKAKAPHMRLVKQLRDVYREEFGAPLAGRIRNIAPFYPFDLKEQAVVAHKFLLELADNLRKPIDQSPAVNCLVGHAHLAIKNDGKLCTHIAEQDYHAKLGARSLKTAVDQVQHDFYTEYVATDEEVDENMNAGPLDKYVLGLQPVGGKGESEIYVERDGIIHYYRGQGDVDEEGEYLGAALRDLHINRQGKKGVKTEDLEIDCV